MGAAPAHAGVPDRTPAAGDVRLPLLPKMSVVIGVAGTTAGTDVPSIVRNTFHVSEPASVEIESPATAGFVDAGE